MSNFHPLEVVGRGSETQLQVGENLNYLISALRVKLLLRLPPVMIASINDNDNPSTYIMRLNHFILFRVNFRHASKI